MKPSNYIADDKEILIDFRTGNDKDAWHHLKAMNFLRQWRSSRPAVTLGGESRGFTLMELMVVVAIIGITLGIGGRYMISSETGSVQQASATVGGIFQLARSTAILWGVKTSVRIYKKPSDPDKHLRYVVPAYFDQNTSNWKPLDKGTYLPQKVFFDAVNSSSLSPDQPGTIGWVFSPATGESEWYSYDFDPNGNLLSAQAQVVLSAGHTASANSEPILNAKIVAGFWINRVGAQSYFDSEDGIVQ